MSLYFLIYWLIGNSVIYKSLSFVKNTIKDYVN